MVAAVVIAVAVVIVPTFDAMDGIAGPNASSILAVRLFPAPFEPFDPKLEVRFSP